MEQAMDRSPNFVTRVDTNAVGEDVDCRVVSITAPASTAAEQYRLLYHRLERLRTVRPLKTVMFTSAVAGEGKTVTAVNLALCAAQANAQRRVLLVDFDLRRPKVHSYLGIRPAPGITEVLAGDVPLPSAVRRFASTRLAVLPAGSAPEDAVTLLHGGQLQGLLAPLAEHFDEIYIDAPPCLAFADANALAPNCHGIVLVVKAGATSAAHVASAMQQFPSEQVVGCVLNGVDVAEVAYR